MAAPRIFTYINRLTISRKILLGYLSLVALLIVVSVFALLNLKKVNSINESILNLDIPLIEGAEKMIDNILAQELYARRYSILKNPEVLSFFSKKSRDFDVLVEEIRPFLDVKKFQTKSLIALKKEYNDILVSSMQHLENPSSELGKEYEDKIAEKQDELIWFIQDMSSKAAHDQITKTRITSTIGTSAFLIVFLICSAGILLSIAAAVLITRNISGAVHKLERATEIISEGKFDHTPDMENHDELGKLSHAFSRMAGRLKRLERIYLDASPSTKLPGSTAVENVLKSRLNSGAPLAFCFIDLDDFKSFNDRYGYSRGNALIQATGEIIVRTVDDFGSKGDFIGHIGGDDFVLITTPDRYEVTCKAIIEHFDAMVPDYYGADDRKRGFFLSRNRQGLEVRLPLTTISIAVVTNQNRKLTSTVEVGEIAAELKEYAKSLPGSISVVDKREESAQGFASKSNVLPFPKNSADRPPCRHTLPGPP